MTESVRLARKVAAGGALLAAVTGCGTFSDNDAAASVEGTEVSQDLFQQMVDVFAENSDLTQVIADEATASVASADVRGFLTRIVVDAASNIYLADHGEAVTQADRDQYLEETPLPDRVAAFPQDILDVLIDSAVGGQARDRIAVPSADALRQQYEDSPVSLGLLCLRQVVLASESAADDVLDQLADGADFFEVAAANSIDPAGADNGGVVFSGSGQPCAALPELAQQFGSAFVTAAIDARIGVPTDPIQTAAGWHVLLVRPYDEIADSVDAQYTASASDLMFIGYLATADITVDPRYGRWDPAAATVVALR